MPVRARLLDMGQVTPLRAHSLRLALAEALGPEDDPALLVACAATSLVAIGEEREVVDEVDLEACDARRVQVMRLPGDATAGLIAEGDLLLWLILPEGRAAELNLPAAPAGRQAWLVSLLTAAAGAETLGVGTVGVDTVASSLVLTVCLGVGDAADPPAQSPAELAESLLQVLERQAGLELVPSMPLPEELDAVYEWDQRLVAAAERETAPTMA
jgi:hypothetical protein